MRKFSNNQHIQADYQEFIQEKNEDVEMLAELNRLGELEEARYLKYKEVDYAQQQLLYEKEMDEQARDSDELRFCQILSEADALMEWMTADDLFELEVQNENMSDDESDDESDLIYSEYLLLCEEEAQIQAENLECYYRNEQDILDQYWHDYLNRLVLEQREDQSTVIHNSSKLAKSKSLEFDRDPIDLEAGPVSRSSLVSFFNGRERMKLKQADMNKMKKHDANKRFAASQ